MNERSDTFQGLWLSFKAGSIMVAVLLQFKVGKTNVILSLQDLPQPIGDLTRGSFAQMHTEDNQQDG